MNFSLEYFDQVSSFGPSAWALGLVIAADLLFTAAHIWQEWKGEKCPLYRTFGAIVGFWFPRPVGFAVFTVLLAFLLWATGIAAYAARSPIFSELPVRTGIAALGFLLGARLGDSIISHWLLDLIGYRPNPGLSSTALYTLEAVFIVVAFRRGLEQDMTAALLGMVAGFAFFLSILPGMAFLRMCIESCRRDRWIPGQPIPDWAITT